MNHQPWEERVAYKKLRAESLKRWSKPEAKELLKEVDKIRKAKGLSKKQLSLDAGLSANTISNWTNGGIEPTLSKLIQVIDALGYQLRIAPAKSEGDKP